MNAVIEHTDELHAQADVPPWFCPGHEFRVDHTNSKRSLFVHVCNGTSWLTIGPQMGGEWMVKYHKTLLPGCESGLEGTLFLSPEELQRAFRIGVKDHRPAPHEFDMIARFGADDACPGKFIRTGDCVCIPGPGTGLETDQALSIHVTDRIREGIRTFLS